jgi:hypothetical protein
MKEIKTIRFRSIEDRDMWYKNPDILSEKVNLLLTKFNDPDTDYNGLHLRIYSDSDDYIIMLEECKKLDLEPEVAGFRMEYTKSEINKAEYFLLKLGIYGKEDYTESYQTEYEEYKKCSLCGHSYQKQVSDLYIDKKMFGKKQISTTSKEEIVISQMMYEILLDNNISGVEFRPVHHKDFKMKDEPNLYQLLITSIMPPMEDSVLVEEENYCAGCKLHGLFLRSLLCYKKSAIQSIKDFNLTYEHFGGGYNTAQYCIINKKVFKLLKDNKIKGINFDIVSLI